VIFLGRDRNLLHAAAEWLLDAANIPEAPDLSRVIAVVRGSRTSRRLLELLALRAEENGQVLVPPQILTPAALILRLTETSPDEAEEATPLASALAWAQALQQASEEDRNRLFRLPPGGDIHAGLRPLLGLARQLGQLWDEVGGAGLRFREVSRTVAERFPDIAAFESPRWDVLDALHDRVAQILRRRELENRTDLLLRRARDGKILSDPRVVLIGVVEMPRIVRDFIARLPQTPTVLSFASEQEREGFDELGTVRPDYWNRRAADLAPGQIHLVERDRDQAARTASIIAAWRDEGIAPGQITVAAPVPGSLPRLREALETRGLATRRAQGRLAAEAPSFQLLQRVAAYLDREPAEPPAYAAVAALVRHPDAPRIDASEWPALDRFGMTHLPVRFDPQDVEPASSTADRIADVLGRWIDLAPDEIPPRDAATWTRDFLHRVYGTHEESSLSPDGRVAVHAITALRDVLDATVDGRMPWPARVRPADFLHSLAQFLGVEGVPEPPDRNAVELVGWLELMEDDAPALVVTSFHEGAVPESVLSDPFLPGSLRQVLQLGDNDSRMARDGYALAAMLASRTQGRGRVALVAPRFDAEENPVRPSRLLLNGLDGETLARRMWHLAGRREAEPQTTLREGPGFGAAAVGVVPALTTVPVTAFRHYLESPRQFFYLHMLRLRAQGDAPLELEPGDVGGLIHEVLARFGAEIPLRDSTDAAEIETFVLAEFNHNVHARFGKWTQPAVEVQIEEIKRRLRGFAPVQARLRRDGWTIRHVEGAGQMTCELAAADQAGLLAVTGKIDRIDSDATGERWRIIDYKTSSKAKDPFKTHFGREDWRDLQLPLYLKLAAPFAREKWNVELTPDNCDLVYFQLPEDEKTAAISAPFPPAAIEEGWARAAEVAGCILRGEFEENPALRADRTDPALLALCGQVGIASSVGEDARGETGEE
jgi:ATP-dependent helicase/nuclease subunit B